MIRLLASGKSLGKQISPYGRVEEDQQRKQFQTSGQHIKHKYIFGKRMEQAEILRRPYQFQPGAYVVDGGRNGRKAGDQIPVFKGHCQHGSREDDHKSDEINIDGTDDFVLDRLSVAFYLF